MSVDYSFKKFKHLGRRAILPLLSDPDVERAYDADLPDFDLPDLSNIQGDIIYLFPKKAENFIFFRINDVGTFKTALQSFKPTTSEDVKDNLAEIIKAKVDALHTGSVRTVDIAQYQIAFTRMGLNFLGVQENTGDIRFDNRCMRDDKTYLGDQRTWDTIFDKTSYDEVNGSVENDDGALHGVITVAGSSPENCTQASNDVVDLFGPSITVSGGEAVEGRARPPPYKGHEHFGFQDGISQPALRGLVAPHPGQIQVDPGVIIMGYPGDPVLDDPNIEVKRPSWTKDGTILVFRKLEQSVIEFEKYLTDNGPRWSEFIPGGDISPKLTDEEGSELFGARLIGRWKSGAPLAKCPFRDDTDMADDPDRNNDFDYVVRDNPAISRNEPSDYYCPFTIHTRKTAPRNLDPYIQSKYLESGSIVRGGLPYGPEVTDQERQDVLNGNSDAELKRGLLFNCYMSSLDSGFVRQSVGYAGNDFFPITSLVPKKPGQDPIIGGPPPEGSSRAPRGVDFETPDTFANGDQVDLRLTGADSNKIEVSGFAKVTTVGARPPPGDPNPFFVTSRGGEYFFVPSVSTLTAWANDPTAMLDILFLLDATGSMQKYIDQVRDTIQQMCDSLVASGKWSKDNLRFGFITFRDHPPQDDTFVTTEYPFDTDVAVVKSNLANVVAAGGGDGPEAQPDALAGALSVDWKDDATKVAVLITDSPPHGINEDEDGFPDGCPLQNDPVRIANRMAQLGITLHVLACEPTLSTNYSTALDFYNGITQKTGGKLFALADVQALITLMVGSVLETDDIEALATKHGADIRQQGSTRDADVISQDLYTQLLSSGVKLTTFNVEDIYQASDDGDENVQTWYNAKQIDDTTKSQIKVVKGFRLKKEYRNGGKQSMSSQEQPVNLDQVKRVVRKSLVKGT